MSFSLLTSGQNLEAWEQAKREIDQIPDHPNRVATQNGDNQSTGEPAVNGTKEPPIAGDGH